MGRRDDGEGPASDTERRRKRRKRPLLPAVPRNHGAFAASVVVAVLLATVVPSGDALYFSQSKRISKRTFDPLYSSAVTHWQRATSIAVASSAFPEDGSVYQSSSRVAGSNSVAFSAALQVNQSLKRQLRDNLRQSSYDQALQTVQKLLQLVGEASGKLSNEENLELSATVDTEIQTFTLHTFSPPSKDRKRVLAGVDVIYMQLSVSGLAAPYNSVPKGTLLNALSALTGLTSNREEGGISRSLDESFRILQRLITGVGVRGSKPTDLSEKDFTQVLNAFCVAGDMPMAHRIVALQERTAHAPPVSPVAYSVLLKGYGRLRDLANVEKVRKHAETNQIASDTVMLNTLIDAYINCNAMDKAEAVFADMKEGGAQPNRRTYNTVLKGWAKQGALPQAQALASEMKQLKLWDAITTNTLLHAAVTAGDFGFAEDVLAKHSMRTGKYKQHPNVEAYTELLDGYAKAGQLDRALAVLQTMQQRGVEPNEVTYTCLMGGLGRSQKIDLARKTFGYMESTGLRPTTKSYNALISGLVSETIPSELDGRVDEAMKLLRDMMQVGVRPNSVTVSVLVDALGRCRIPRVTEATLLVEQLERQRFIPLGNAKVVTALVRTCGKAGDIQGVLKAFQTLKHYDTVAVNAFMDACCRCKRDKVAMDAFDLHFRKTKSVSPDVISYSVVIGALLKHGTADSLKQARNKYLEMKTWGKIKPDNGLVDVILKAMIRIGTAQLLSKQDVHFVASVLKDAEKLCWQEGQLDRRKRAVRAVLADRVRDSWRKDAIDSLIPTATSDDDLFQRKGWNKVDSGFSLWGRGQAFSATKGSKSERGVDQFLQSHGWNDVDSGFRLY